MRPWRGRYGTGIVFGSSAGTACISGIAITGQGDFTVIDADEVEIRAGFGPLPGAILEQRSAKGQRENCLFGLVPAPAPDGSLCSLSLPDAGRSAEDRVTGRWRSRSIPP